VSGYNPPVTTVSQRQIARAATTVMAAFVLSNLVGLVRQILIAQTFGTSRTLDAFTVAQQFPTLLFNLVAGGALASAFVPTFTSFLTRDDRAEAWRLASGVVNLVFIALVALSGLAFALAPLIIQLTGPGLAPAEQTLAVQLLHILLLSPLIFGVSGLLMGILNAHQHFLLPALAPTFYWLGMIFGLLVWVPGMGIHGLAWGTVLGAGLHLAIQLPGLRGLGARYWPDFGVRNSSVREVMRLMGPRLIGVAAVQINFLVNFMLATFLAGGASALDAASRVFTMPQVIIAQGIAIAALPTFSAMIARGERAEMRASLADTLRVILFLSLPATVGLILLRAPVIALLFQRQSFNAHSTELVAWALMFYAFGLVSHSVVEIVSRAFYALHDTATPVVIGTAAMGLNLALSFLFTALFKAWGWWPHGGLALANTVATTLEMIGLGWVMRRRLSGLDFARAWPGLWRALIASMLMGVALWGWMALTNAQSVWVVGAGGVALGALVFWGAAYALGSGEARTLPALVWARLARTQNTRTTK
jgi:putative peptidoglycan lipid II flippase